MTSPSCGGRPGSTVERCSQALGSGKSSFHRQMGMSMVTCGTFTKGSLPVPGHTAPGQCRTPSHPLWAPEAAMSHACLSGSGCLGQVMPSGHFSSPRFCGLTKWDMVSLSPYPPAFRRTLMLAAVPSRLLTLQVYSPRSSAVTTSMVSSSKFFRVEEMRMRPLLSRMAPSAQA